MTTIHPLVAEAVGENLDALIILDLRGYHLGRILYRGARALAGEPLTLRAARAILSGTELGDSVLLVTGFPFIPYGKPELDGLVGTAVLARALAIAKGLHPVVVTDAATAPAMRELMTVAGLNLYEDAEQMRSYPHSGAVLTFTQDADRAEGDAHAVLYAFSPKALVTIEKPGANDRGVYHQGTGADVSHLVAKTDALLTHALARGIVTVAIGDLGNELGMGSLAKVMEAETSFGQQFVAAPTGSIAAVGAAEHVIAAAVSDWAAYALSAMIAFLTGNNLVLHTASLQRQLLWTAVRCGVLDGSGRGEPAVDGVGEEYTARLVELMRDIIEIMGEHGQRYEKPIDNLAKLRARTTEAAKGASHA